MTASRFAVLGEISWTPGKNEQAIDRCVLAGQPILTPRGWKPIEDIEIGESVIGRDGQPHKVTDKWSRLARGSHTHNTKTIVELIVRGWYEKIRLTADHRLPMDGGWIEAGELRPGDEIEMPAPITGKFLQAVDFPSELRARETFMNNFGVAQRTRAVAAPLTVDLSDDAMFMFGYYIGDGFSSVAQGKSAFVSVCGHRNQKETYLDRCVKWFESYGVGVGRYDQKKALTHEIRAYSASWANWFISQFGRVGPEKRLPEWLFTASGHQRQIFMEGWMCSDGYARQNKGSTIGGSFRFEIISQHYRLTSDCARLLMGLGVKPCVTVGSKDQYSIQWTMGEKQTMKVSEILMRWPKPDERVWDLSVEDSESFVIGLAVVHNCHRITQTRHVDCPILTFPHAIEERCIRVNARKALDARAVLDLDLMEGVG